MLADPNAVATRNAGSQVRSPSMNAAEFEEVALALGSGASVRCSSAQRCNPKQESVMTTDLVPIRAALSACMNDLARFLCGEPNRRMSNRRELRFGRKGSLAVAISGPKAGSWCDHETNKGGGPLDLIMVARECSFRDAFRHRAGLPWVPRCRTQPTSLRRPFCTPPTPRTRWSASRVRSPTGSGRKTRAGRSSRHISLRGGSLRLAASQGFR